MFQGYTNLQSLVKCLDQNMFSHLEKKMTDILAPWEECKDTASWIVLSYCQGQEQHSCLGKISQVLIDP